MTDLFERDQLLVVLLKDPLGPPSTLPTEAIPQPLQSLAQGRVLA